MSERSKSEARELGRKGGKKSGEVRSANAEMRKRLEQIVKMTLKEGKADKIKNLADAKAAIPMAGEITSLNVSVASAVLMYEAVRQRLGK